MLVHTVKIELGAAGLCFCLLTGCGGTSTAPPSDAIAEKGDEVTVVTTRPQGSDASSKSDERRRDEQWTDENGRSFLGKVPVDVFFDHPHAVASDVTVIEGRSRSPETVASGVSPASSVEESEMVSEGAVVPQVTKGQSGNKDAGGSGAGWEHMLPIEILEAEVTEARIFLAKGLRSVGAFKSSMLSIPPQAAVIAVLAEVAQEHAQKVSWKDDAAYVRDLAKQMNENPLKRGKKDQVRLLALFENIADTLNRSRPAGLEAPPGDDSFADVAEMRFLMMRMAEAERKMKSEVGTEKALVANGKMVNHEMAILRAMTHIVTLEGYGYADDDEFTSFAQAIESAAIDVQQACSDGDFAQYELSLSKIGQACSECHSVFKNN